MVGVTINTFLLILRIKCIYFRLFYVLTSSEPYQLSRSFSQTNLNITTFFVFLFLIVLINGLEKQHFLYSFEENPIRVVYNFEV